MATVLISRLNKWSLRSCVIVKSKHTMKTCSLRQFQRYPTTYMCWAMTKPLLWIRLILSHSKGWVGLNTYRLWGIIGIVLMSTFLIHAYFLRSRHFAKPRLFSREISTVLRNYQAFLCEIHPSPCKQNAGLRSFGVLKTSFGILKTSFTLSEKQFLSFFLSIL